MTSVGAAKPNVGMCAVYDLPPMQIPEQMLTLCSAHQHVPWCVQDYGMEEEENINWLYTITNFKLHAPGSWWVSWMLVDPTRVMCIGYCLVVPWLWRTTLQCCRAGAYLMVFTIFFSWLLNIVKGIFSQNCEFSSLIFWCCSLLRSWWQEHVLSAA